jgi:hypothetical protein
LALAMARNKIARVLLIVLGILVSTPAAAGGDYFTAEVLDFRALGNDVYRIVLRQMTPIYGSKSVPTDPLVIYLRHDEAAMRGAREEVASTEKYLAAIEFLKRQIAQSAIIQFGFWGSGVIPIDGKPGEFQSNSLTVEEPGIVFSWHRAV